MPQHCEVYSPAPVLLVLVFLNPAMLAPVFPELGHPAVLLLGLRLAVGARVGRVSHTPALGTGQERLGRNREVGRHTVPNRKSRDLY